MHAKSAPLLFPHVPEWGGLGALSLQEPHFTPERSPKGRLCATCAASFLKLSPSPRALLVRRSPLPSVVRTRQRARDVPPLLFFRKRDLLAQFLPRAAFGNSASVFLCGGHCAQLALACGPVRATAAETEALGPRPARSTSSRPTHSGPSLTSPDHYLRTHLPGPALSEPTSCAPQVIHRSSACCSCVSLRPWG